MGGRLKLPSCQCPGKVSVGGRDHTGQISVRHRGGGVKRLRRPRAAGSGVGVVRGFHYDGNRTGRLARRKVRTGGGLRQAVYVYVLAVVGRAIGDRVVYGCGEGLCEFVMRGSTSRREDLVWGTIISNIGNVPGGRGVFLRAAGMQGELRGQRLGMARIRRPGGKIFEVSGRCTATVGVISGAGSTAFHGQAGRTRRRGIRPTVRGEAINPIDHPHGGRTRGGGPEVTPWTRLAKGVRTRKQPGQGWMIAG